MSKKKFKVGDTVETFLFNSSHKKRVIRGKIKAITQEYGTESYVVSGGVVEDFSVRTIKKV